MDVNGCRTGVRRTPCWRIRRTGPVEEILNGALCAGVVASPYQEVREMTTEALHSTRYRVYQTHDLIGVQLTSAAVPGLACLLGLTRQLQGSGVGMHAMVLERTRRIGRPASAIGADEATLWGLAGIGDLVSAQARDGTLYYESGRDLARGSVGQGPWHLAAALLARAKAKQVELPLTASLLAMQQGEDPIDVVQRLMARASTDEHGGTV